MQRGRHRPDDVIADEDREHEDGEAKHRRIDGATGARRERMAERLGGLAGIELRGLGGLAGSIGGGPRPFERVNGRQIGHQASPVRRFRGGFCGLGLKL